jgi:hypothetical protein
MHEDDQASRVAPLDAGGDGRDLPQSGNQPSPSLPSGPNEFNPFEFDALNADEEP